MKISLTRQFRVAYAQRIEKDQRLDSLFWERLENFEKNPNDPIFRDHPLQGNLKDCRAFSVDNDCRVIYQKIAADHIQLVDIGTHREVY